MPAPTALPPHTLPQPSSTGPFWLRVLRHLAIGLVLCVSVAVFLTLLFRDPFKLNLVFSLCIGGCIQGLIELGRHGISRWQLQRGMRSPELSQGWPGWTIMAPYVVASAVLGHTVGSQLAGWLLDIPNVPLIFSGNTRGLVVVFTITITVSAMTTYHFYVRGQLNAAAAQAEAARRLASENQLRLLQSQLEPHMLFNTLANLRVLIGLDPQRAQAMLDRLIAFLRATLSASRADAHALSVEFDRLADYLALMQVRMGPRLSHGFSLPEALRDRPVPPLLLQPLVENCIKHGLEPKLEGGRIDVQAASRQADGHDWLVLSVRDTGVGLPPATATPAPAGSGFGTQQVRERLATLYGGLARLELQRLPDEQGGGTLATVHLPQDVAPLPPAAPLPTSHVRC
ncbi:MAG: histidine kinase [Burkholderiaceae bacterium]|nr:histidine kinase [Burkholderiaceae bacterium]